MQVRSVQGAIWAFMGAELALGAVALAVLRKRGYAIASLMPRGWQWQDVSLVLLLYLTAKLFADLALLPWDGTAVGQPDLTGVGPAVALQLWQAVPLALVNGAYMELVLLGFLQRGLSHYGAAVAIGCCLLLRLMLHVCEGPYGVPWVLSFGLVVSLYFWRTGRLGPVVMVHAVADLAMLARNLQL